MPGSGKSTIGKILADRLGWQFVDLDILIKEKEGKGHDQLIKELGEEKFLEIEEKQTLALDFNRTVFSPGGSVIYCPAAMEKLKRETRIFYLYLPLEAIEKRLGKNIDSRGIIGLKEKGLTKLFEERNVLYKNFSNQIIDCSGLTEESIIQEILQR